jgi:hypothetical protein
MRKKLPIGSLIMLFANSPGDRCIGVVIDRHDRKQDGAMLYVPKTAPNNIPYDDSYDAVLIFAN